MEEKNERTQPKQMYWLACCEMCQRFAFWGIANTLVLYLVQFFGFEEPRADHIFGLFTGLAFFLPALGGYVADRLSYRLPILLGTLSTGLGCLALIAPFPAFLYVGLVLLSVGASLFTPSIYASLGHLYHARPHLRESGFTIYYAAVNLGVFVAMLITGFLGQYGWWKLSFFIAASLQGVSFLIYRKVAKEIVTGSVAGSAEGVSASCQTSSSGTKIYHQYTHLSHHEKDRLFHILILSLFSIIFWLAYNQGGSSMTLFALHFTHRTLGSSGSFELPPAWLLSVESLYLVLFAFPLATLYHMLKKKGLDPSPARKASLSLLAMTLCFVIMMLGASGITGTTRVAEKSPFFLLTAYFFMALGEMLIAPIGLSLITHISPRKMTALLVGVWYFCIGIAFYLGGYLAGWMGEFSSLSNFFGVFAALTFLAAFVLFANSRRLDEMRHLS